MQIKNIDEIIRDIKKEFDKEKEGWEVLRGRDKRGHYDTYVLGPDSLYQMKTELKNPYQPIGVGSKIMKSPDEDIKLKFKGKTFPFSEIYPHKEKAAIIAMGIGKYSPSSSKNLKNIISSQQEKLDVKLNRELNKLLDKEGMFKEYL